MLQHIPTHVVTGFLGAGKTTLIKALLSQKPVNERWAVLVNEFGEVGLDAQIIQNSKTDLDSENGVVIKEVPGGCMCCVAGVPMQIALNRLLNVAKPDLLIIEPTGLGHPKEVLKVLKSDDYRQVLNLGSTLTLVDARNIANPRYTNHAIFRQQLDVADIIVASKSDLYVADELIGLNDFLKREYSGSVKKVITAEQGYVDISWLKQTGTMPKQLKDDSQQVERTEKKSAGVIMFEDLKLLSAPERDIVCHKKQADGFYSIGWVFSNSIVFDQVLVKNFLRRLKMPRVKAVLNTGSKSLTVNNTYDEESMLAGGSIRKSLLELIDDKPFNQSDLEQQLRACFVVDE